MQTTMKKTFIDIFSRADKHRTYEIPQRKQFVHHEPIQSAKNYSFLAAILLLFISAATGYFA